MGNILKEVISLNGNIVWKLFWERLKFLFRTGSKFLFGDWVKFWRRDVVIITIIHIVRRYRGTLLRQRTRRRRFFKRFRNIIFSIFRIGLIVAETCLVQKVFEFVSYFSFWRRLLAGLFIH